MADAVLFHNGPGNFILTTPFLQNLNSPEIVMLRDHPSLEDIRGISSWPVVEMGSSEELTERYDRVFVLWGWPADQVPVAPNVTRQPRPLWDVGCRHEAATYCALLPDHQPFPTRIRTAWSWRPCLGEHEKLVAFCNGAQPAWKNKLWPLDRWVELARGLVGSDDVQIAVIGGPAERPFGAGLKKAIGRRCWDFTGVWNLARSSHFLTWCQCVVTNDTAIMHAADALAKPLVVVWGWTNWEKNAPFNHPQSVRVVRSDGGGCPHYPCHGRAEMWTCEDAVCMKAIPADSVLEEVRHVL